MIEIRGKRVILRTMTREEYHSLFQKYVADPLMNPDPYVYDAEKVDASYDIRCRNADWYASAGIFINGGKVIGDMLFKRIDYDKGRCELGIMLANDLYKGMGYGSEAFALAVDYAFGRLGLTSLYADTMGSNIRMQRILERLGFRCYSRLQSCYDMKDRWEDRLDYVLEKPVISKA